MRKGGVATRSRGDRPGVPKGRLSSTRLRSGGRVTSTKKEQQARRDRAEDYLAMVSHELRTPLTALRLQLEMALREADGAADPGELLGRLEPARRQVERLVTMVEQLLDASRISAGKFELRPAPVDLRQVIDEVVERVKEQITRARCEITVTAPESVVGEWDRFGLEQVVTNLLVNAAKYGGGKPIEIIVEADEERVILRVVDRGIGIARADHTRIFERYERCEGARRQGGLGLGLWIVSSIVKAHGGRIHVESRLGQGATFVVELLRQPGAGAITNGRNGS